MRIPGAVMAATRIEVDQQVDIREENGRIVIVPLLRQPYDVDALVEGITDENRHAEVETGQRVGREVW